MIDDFRPFNKIHIVEVCHRKGQKQLIDDVRPFNKIHIVEVCHRKGQKQVMVMSDHSAPYM